MSRLSFADVVQVFARILLIKGNANTNLRDRLLHNMDHRAVLAAATLPGDKKLVVIAKEVMIDKPNEHYVRYWLAQLQLALKESDWTEAEEAAHALSVYTTSEVTAELRMLKGHVMPAIRQAWAMHAVKLGNIVIVKECLQEETDLETIEMLVRWIAESQDRMLSKGIFELMLTFCEHSSSTVALAAVEAVAGCNHDDAEKYTQVRKAMLAILSESCEGVLLKAAYAYLDASGGVIYRLEEQLRADGLIAEDIPPLIQRNN
jgi:hypothetical protein